MKAIILKDTHFRFGFTPPRGRTPDFEDAILDKINQVMDIAKEHNATTLILTGDSTDIKAPSAYGIEQVRKNLAVFKHLRTHFTDIYDIAGNHSLPFSSLEYKEQSFYHLLAEQNLITDISNRSVMLTPTLRLYGIPYLPNHSQVKELMLELDKDPTPTIYLIHEHLVPSEKDRLPFGACFTYEEITKDLRHCKAIIAGHLHKGYPTTTHNGILIINQWNFTRLARDYYALNGDHIPEATLLDFETLQYRTFQLKVKHFDEAFRIEELKTQQSLEMDISEFVSGANLTSDQTTDIENIPDKLRERVQHYLDLAKQQLGA